MSKVDPDTNIYSYILFKYLNKASMNIVFSIYVYNDMKIKGLNRWLSLTLFSFKSYTRNYNF